MYALIWVLSNTEHLDDILNHLKDSATSPKMMPLVTKGMILVSLLKTTTSSSRRFEIIQNIAQKDHNIPVLDYVLKFVSGVMDLEMSMENAEGHKDMVSEGEYLKVANNLKHVYDVKSRYWH